MFATVLLTGGCGAAVDVRVDVARSGHGSVTVQVEVPRATAAEVADLHQGLPVADLRQGGWAISGPRPGPNGSTLISASHPFSSLSQVPVLVADIAGSGPPGSAGRPFRLVVSESPGTLEDRFRASGAVDLHCSLSCFDDPGLAQAVGYPLGAPQAELARLLGPRPGRDLTFRFELALPGHVTQANTAARAAPGDLVWAVELGRARSLAATTESVNTAFVVDLLLAVGAGALVVATSAAWLLRRRRRGPASVTAPE